MKYRVSVEISTIGSPFSFDSATVLTTTLITEDPITALTAIWEQVSPINEDNNAERSDV